MHSRIAKESLAECPHLKRRYFLAFLRWQKNFISCFLNRVVVVVVVVVVDRRNFGLFEVVVVVVVVGLDASNILNFSLHSKRAKELSAECRHL